MLGSNPGPLQLVHCQSDALTTRLDLIKQRLPSSKTDAGGGVRGDMMRGVLAEYCKTRAVVFDFQSDYN
jgi:hypothetical protein